MESTKSKSSTGEQQPASSKLSQSPKPIPSQLSDKRPDDLDAESESELEDLSEIPRRGRRNRRISDPGAFPHREFALDSRAFCSLTFSVVTPPLNHPHSYPLQPRGPSVTRTQTVEFAPSPQLRGRHQAKQSVDDSRIQPSVSNAETHLGVTSKSSPADTHRLWLTIQTGSATFPHPVTGHPHRQSVPAIRRGFGGFPMPHEIFSSIFHKFFPGLERRIKRTVTIPVSQTLTSHHLEGGQNAAGSRPVNYITFNAMVGRNSTFRDLGSEQTEELCGIEFKALNCLVWIVPCVCFRLSSTTDDADYLLLPSITWSSRPSGL